MYLVKNSVKEFTVKLKYFTCILLSLTNFAKGKFAKNYKHAKNSSSFKVSF